jgi:hypothetical protein
LAAPEREPTWKYSDTSKIIGGSLKSNDENGGHLQQEGIAGDEARKPTRTLPGPGSLSLGPSPLKNSFTSSLRN